MAVLLRPAAIAGGRQVWPVAEDEEGAREAEASSQRLVEAVARGDAREAGELLAAGRADVNYAGVVWLRARRVAEAEPREDAAAEAIRSKELVIEGHRSQPRLMWPPPLETTAPHAPVGATRVSHGHHRHCRSLSCLAQSPLPPSLGCDAATRSTRDCRRRLPARLWSVAITQS